MSTTGDGHDAYARKHFLRNAAMLITENAGFIVAITFVGATTVLPTFVTRLGGSAFLVGLLATCQSGGWLLPQLAAAGIVEGKPRVLPYILVPLYFGRPAFLVVALLTLLLGPQAAPLVLTVLFVALFLFFVTDGLASVPWFELTARTVPPDRRGRVFGIAQIAGGLGGVGIGALVAVILGSPALPFPANYALLFALSSGVFFVNLIPLWLIKEPDHVVPATGEARPAGVRVYLVELYRIVRGDRNLQRLTASRLLLGLSTAVFPFYVLFMDDVLGLGAERLGLFTSAQVLGGFVGGLVIGWIADHVGTRTVIRLSGGIGAAAPALGLLMLAGRGAPGPVMLAAGVVLFLLVGIASSTNLIGFMNYLMEVAPLERRTAYVGLFNTVAGVLVVFPPLAGSLLEATSFGLLFILAMAAGAASLLVSLGLRRPVRVVAGAPEPQRG